MDRPLEGTLRIQKWVRASVLALGAACFALPVSAQAADDDEGIDTIMVTVRLAVSAPSQAHGPRTLRCGP